MFERFFNLSNELLCIADFEGNFVEVNDSFTKVLGYSKEHLLSKKFLDFIHPDDKEATINEVLKLSAGQETIKFENRYIDSDGNIHIFSWNSRPDPHTGQIYAIARDVTEERKVNNQYLQLRKVLENNVIFAKTDANGVINQVNQKFCEISGYSPEELIGRTHTVVNSGVHDTAFFDDMWQTICSGKTWTGKITNKRKDGSLYHVESIVVPIYSIEGDIESYVALRFDITESVAVKEQSEKILNILNETSAIAKVGGWELDVVTGELSWTDETFKILGVEKTNGRNPVLPEGLQLFTDEHKPIIDDAVARGMEFGEPYALELQALTPCGDVKWIYTDGRPTYKDDKIVTLSGTIQDIHERKLTELKFNQERQKSIQNSKFAALGELAASVAHEINNPLGIISGYAEILKYKDDGSSVDKIDAILKSCDRISYIVKNLKRFSRTDELPAKKQENLVEICEEAISLINPKLKRDLVNISVEMLENAPVTMQFIEIEQVIINLINNAIDAVKSLPERWVKISLTEDETCYKLRIEDSGNGIPQSVQLKMFDPFYTTKDINKGTGLGLSVVKGILDDHNATIVVDNDNANTCFCISFPKSAEG